MLCNAMQWPGLSAERRPSERLRAGRFTASRATRGRLESAASQAQSAKRMARDFRECDVGVGVGVWVSGCVEMWVCGCVGAYDPRWATPLSVQLLHLTCGHFAANRHTRKESAIAIPQHIEPANKSNSRGAIIAKSP